jgi:predicted Rossmann fold flavoprotein
MMMIICLMELTPTRLVGQGLSYRRRRLGVVVALSSAPRNNKRTKSSIAIIGGGASGIFASIHASSNGRNAVTVLEAGSKTLTKVKISGGGRCNVLHDASKPASELLAGYPRGSKELRGLLSKHFPVSAAAAWFVAHGVELKTEPDGRMFPTTDSSQTVIDALLTAAENAKVQIKTRTKVEAILPDYDNNSFQVTYTVKMEDDTKKTSTARFDAVILATGSAPAGYVLVRDHLAHPLVDTVPSLFTLNCKHAVKEGNLLYGLSGVSVAKGRVSFKLPSEGADAEVTSKRKKATWIEQEGPLLITHHGLSGPAALRLSAFGAREFATANYRGDLKIHWAPDLGRTDDVFDQLWATTVSNPKKTVSSQCPVMIKSVAKDGTISSGSAIPKRLWSTLVQAAGFDDTQVWGQAGKKLVRSLAEHVAACPLELTGKGTFKEEFVTAGGVSLTALDMKTMQSRKVNGLFFCGELINVDGVTGGYNFLNCWATGYMAGTSAAAYVQTRNEPPSC